MTRQTLRLELNTDNLFTLEQFLKALTACGSMDWEHCEFRTILEFVPDTDQALENVQALLSHNKAFGVGGLVLGYQE